MARCKTTDMKRLALPLILALAACEPAPSLPPNGMTIRVLVTDGVDLTGWLPDHQAVLERVMVRMNATGYRFVIVREGPHELTLRTFAATSNDHLAGSYDRRTRVAEVDYARVHGSWLDVSIEHELMHGLTDIAQGHVLHVCDRPGQADDCHPTVFGQAILAPWLPADGVPWEETYAPPRTELYQSDLDAITTRVE